MTKQIIEQDGSFTVIQNIPIRTEEEQEAFNKRILYELHNYFSNDDK